MPVSAATCAKIIDMAKSVTTGLNYASLQKGCLDAGAAVTPTAPKSALEPVPPGPKPIAPANPATR